MNEQEREELKEVFNSILCLTSEGVEFMSRTELASRIAQDARKGYDLVKDDANNSTNAISQRDLTCRAW